MRTKQIDEHKKTLKLTKKQKEILVGLILGDGHLETLNNGKTYRLKVEHSLKQREYLNWLYSNFKDWINKAPEVRKRTSLGKIIETYGFTTYTSSILGFYAKHFYFNGKKIIPNMIDKMITPQSLAIWFMDDGSIKSKAHKALVIHTHGYSRNDLELITKVLENKFGLKIGLQKQYDKWRLYIYSDSVDNFKRIISPYMLPSMRYKFNDKLGNKNA